MCVTVLSRVRTYLYKRRNSACPVSRNSLGLGWTRTTTQKQDFYGILWEEIGVGFSLDNEIVAFRASEHGGLTPLRSSEQGHRFATWKLDAAAASRQNQEEARRRLPCGSCCLLLLPLPP